MSYFSPSSEHRRLRGTLKSTTSGEPPVQKDNETNTLEEAAASHFNTLCDKCRRILCDEKVPRFLASADGEQERRSMMQPVFRGRHHNIHALTRSAEAGCSLCVNFCSRMKEESRNHLETIYQSQDDLSVEGLVLTVRCRCDSLDCRDLKSWEWTLYLAEPSEAFISDQLPAWEESGHGDYTNYGGRVIDGTTMFARFWIDDNPDLECPSTPQPYDEFGMPPTRVLASCNISEESLELARSWMRQCDTGHSKCAQIQEWERRNAPLPARILDIGVLGGSDDMRLALVNDLPDGLLYAALSYCWGTSMQIRLCSDNLEAFQTGIPALELPKTFTDAVMVLRALGVRYLWIDALCIVQDDGKDWEREAAKMQGIYANATLTLAASESLDSHGGLKVSRNPLLLHPCQVAYQTSEGRSCRLSIDFARYDRLFSIGTCHLYTRAWCIQERLTAFRTIHFGRQLFWECYENTACELEPQALSSEGLFPPFSKCDIPLPSDLHMPNRELEQLWKEVVRAYSATQLTLASDKLPAIHGLVSRLLALFNCSKSDYVAGLWRPFLVDQLLWKPLGKAVRPQRYRAPTWSWAAIDGRVSFIPYSEPYQDKALIDIVDVPIEQSTAGQVTAASLKIRGIIFPWNTLADMAEAYLVGIMNALQGWLKGVPLIKGDMDIEGDVSSKPTFFLPLKIIWVDHGDASYNEGTILGLALVPATGSGNGRYERKGLYELTYPYPLTTSDCEKVGAMNIWSRFLLEKNLTRPDESHCLSFDEIFGYTIDIL